MPTEATVYRVLIASPSDVNAEREAARDIVIEWNGAHADEKNVYLEPVMWETHVAPNLGDNPQNIINEQIIDTCDMVIGMFWKRIGTETDSERGGAVEEIKTVSKSKSNAIVGFSQKPIPPEEVDPEQYTALQEFKTECEKNGLIFTYESIDEFRHLLSQHLAKTMSRIISEDSAETQEFARKNEHKQSEYDPNVDHERLQLSSQMHYEQDERNIESVVDHLETIGTKTPYRVLDAGCGYGTVTQSRFGDDDRFDVLGIDVEETVLDIARNRYNADNIEYQAMDVNDIDEADIGTFDLVFSSYLFHHIENQESVLSLLWDRVRDDGALIIRSCDDGQYLHYPPDSDMDYIVEITDEIQGSSDRTHGRRLYTQTKRLTPEPHRVELDLKNYHTAGKNSREREQYWDVFHSNRAHYANVLASREDATKADRKLYDELRPKMERLREKFISNSHFLDSKSVPLVIAYK